MRLCRMGLPPAVRMFRIAGVPAPAKLKAMSFGQQIEPLKAIAAFKASARCVSVDIKRRSASAAIREAVRLYDASEWYCEYHDSPGYRDDGAEFYFRQ